MAYPEISLSKMEFYVGLIYPGLSQRGHKTQDSNSSVLSIEISYLPERFTETTAEFENACNASYKIKNNACLETYSYQNLVNKILRVLTAKQMFSLIRN